MEAPDFVRMEEFRLAQQEADHEKEERRHFERRAEDRMDKIELAQLRQQELLTGKDGRNGISSRLTLAEHIIGWHARLLWMLGGAFATAMIGAVVVKLVS